MGSRKVVARFEFLVATLSSGHCLSVSPGKSTAEIGKVVKALALAPDRNNKAAADVGRHQHVEPQSQLEFDPGSQTNVRS